MVVIFLLVLCAVNTKGSTEGENCIKEGVPGVCTNIRTCSAAQEDIRNKKKPQHCQLGGIDFIVCCVSSVATTTTTAPVITSTQRHGNCVLPPYPDYGTYVTNVPNGKPRKAYNSFTINITCREGYRIEGSQSIFCQKGLWSDKMPKCVSVCHLPPHTSVEYVCIVTDGGVNGTRPCKEYEPHGTFASPRCKAPGYYSPNPFNFMHCIDGSWDYVAICLPECGIVTPDDPQLFLGFNSIRRGELPWHAGIYTKTKQPYRQICGGSLISTRIIISAAHCFWINGKQAESNFAVAVGKLHRAWNNAVDTEKAQHSDVERIHLSEGFRDNEAYFRDDIAVVVVSKMFEINSYIRPVCLDFNSNFEERQLQPGNIGKIAGWNLLSKSTNGSYVVQVIELPYTSIESCITETPAKYRQYITGDKICAGLDNGTKALCTGDTSGGGLAFPETKNGKTKYYLRGVMSSSANKETLCSSRLHTSFTRVLRHELFINQSRGIM